MDALRKQCTEAYQNILCAPLYGWMERWVYFIEAEEGI